VAALLGVFLSLGVHLIPSPAECPKGDCAFAAPAGLRWVSASTNELSVTWDDVPQAFAYRVQLATKRDFSGENVMSTTTQRPSSVGPVVFKGLTPGTSYHARVSVVDKELHQQSDWAAPATYATKGAMNVSVGTYNIHNPDETWGKRAPWVAEGIVGQKLHVLGVQEAYRASERRSLLGYVNNRSAQVNGGAYFGMAPAPDSDLGYDNRILFDTRVVTLIASGAKRYDYQVGDGEVDRWFSWAAFKHRASGWSFLFVTTHLAPGDNRADRKQWKELIKRVNALKSSLHVPWVVVAGDFNTTRFEKPANVMVDRMRENGYGDILGQQYRSFETVDARAQVRKDAWLNSFNGFRRTLSKYDVDNDHNGRSVDWIFASNDLKVPYYRVYARHEDGKLIKPIPSDHFLIWASLAYTPPQPHATIKTAATIPTESLN
jgi:endonuclease/exonuclease/phosphatase family metal-dependent hydrolase